MGLLDSIFRPNKDRDAVIRANGVFKTLTAYKPAFSTWNGAIYESDLVRAAIDARARHISKLKVETYGTAKPSLQSKLKQGPRSCGDQGHCTILCQECQHLVSVVAHGTEIISTPRSCPNARGSALGEAQL